MYTKAIALIAALASAAAAQHTFNYQGSLRNADLPANGSYDMRFTLWTDATPGIPDFQIGSTVTALATPVVDGLFSVSLDLDDDAFQTQSARYLQIEVRRTRDFGYTTLTPRQEVEFTPRAIHALTTSQALGIELPFHQSAGPDVTRGHIFSITNDGVDGVAIQARAPTWGIVGTGSSLPNGSPTIPAPTPTGVFGIGEGVGVAGTSIDGIGVWARTRYGISGEFEVGLDDPGDALYAHTSGPGYAGTFRKTRTTGTTPALLIENSSQSAFAYGVHSIVTPTAAGASSTALRGQNNGTGALGIGVWGSHDGSGWGVYGSSASGLAGRFAGDVAVIGTLSKSGGSFKIDHPQDPENMTLSHSFVESPDMKNIYDGVAILNKQGQAIVTLPSYFNALNQDFRYQLTTIGAYAPVFILSKIESSPDQNSFIISGGLPNLEVSWMVTGIRHDAWANQNRIPTEEYKSNANKGKYLNPEAFNQPKEKGIDYIQPQD